jgi:carbamoyl-phosphate synthase large subunit
MLRPSYVLGGLAMQIVQNRGRTRRIRGAHHARARRTSEASVSDKRPLLVDRYLRDAIEVDVDAICDGEDVFVAGVMEHIEEAGVHSGDSACALPPYSLDEGDRRRDRKQTKKLALALDVRGLINIQFAVKDDEIFILEANPRASRTAPFVAKAINRPIAAAGAKVMAGVKLSEFKLDRPSKKHVAVKEAVFPFARFPGVDPVLGPEMRSTGEVMGLDARASLPPSPRARSPPASICRPPARCFISVKERRQAGAIVPVAKRSDRAWLQACSPPGGTADLPHGRTVWRFEKVNKVA